MSTQTFVSPERVVNVASSQSDVLMACALACIVEPGHASAGAPVADTVLEGVAVPEGVTGVVGRARVLDSVATRGVLRDTANGAGSAEAPLSVLLLDLGLEMRGGQRQVYYLARALHTVPSIRVLVACPRASALAAVLKREGLPCLPLVGRSPLSPLVHGTLLWAIRQHGVRLVHTHDAHAATVGAALKRMCGGKLCLVHSRRVSYPLRSGLRLAKYRYADAIAAVSHEIAKGLITSGIAPDKVCTIHSGIDPSLYTPKRVRGDGRWVFLSVGALTTQKGYSVLVQAMSVLQGMEDLPPWEVRIVGDGPLFQSLLHEAETLHVADRLAMFGRQDSRVFLPDADALLVPSVDGEGSSATIKEGWVTGIPVLCSALPSNLELVTDKLNGLAVAVGNPLALAVAMSRVMLDPARVQSCVRGGFATLTQFTDTRMADATLALYRSLMRAAARTS